LLLHSAGEICLPRRKFFPAFPISSLDGTDGKQARRTKSSSPLGELFDHGCDSWVVYFIPASMYTLCGVYSSPYRLFWIQWSLIFSFISSHWEKYMTGVLYLPWTFDVSQLAVASTCFAAYRWSVNTCTISTIFGYKIVSILEFLLHTSFFLVHIPMTAYNIRTHRSSSQPWHRDRGAYEAFRPSVPLFTLLASSFCWAYLSPSDILNNQPRLFLYCYATVASNVCCKLILAQLCKSRAPVVNELVVLYSVFTIWWCLAIPVDWSVRYEVLFLWILSISVTVGHIYEAFTVVRCSRAP
ncbi:Selenoprotein I, partial [Fasciolopsis buskii]